jgi:enamine deaminase RidA (YjgF/YER057c/UK114 family)
MSLIEELARRGHEWAPQPNQNTTHSLLAAVRDGNVVYVSGQIPTEGDKILSGKVSAGNLQEARRAAELCAVNCLNAVGSLVGPEDIVGVNKLTVFVNGDRYFNQMSIVANAASDLLIAVLGNAGMHARTAVSVAALPYDAMVEIEAVFRVR